MSAINRTKEGRPQRAEGLADSNKSLAHQKRDLLATEDAFILFVPSFGWFEMWLAPDIPR